MSKIKQYSKYFIPIIMALLSYFTICRYGTIKSYDILSWSILIGLLILFLKLDIYNNILKKEIIILSLLFASITIFGKFVYIFQENNEISIFKEFLHIKNIIYIMGVFNLYFMILTNILPKLYSYRIRKNASKIKPSKLFVICLLIILLSWLPYFLNFYPGTISSDSLWELSTVIHHFSSVSDHHPVIHTIFISIPYNIGYKIFETVTAGVALATLTQMIIMATIFSSLIVFLYKRNVNKIILLIVLGFYAILPVHGYYSIVMWKDVIFAGSMLLLTMKTINILEKNESNELTFKNLISFTLISLLCVFFRNNAIYMYFVFVLVTLILFRKSFKVFCIAFAIVIGTYYFVKGPIFTHFNVEKSSSSEYIGMPLQQIGRMTFKNVKFTNKEKELLNKLMPIEKMAVAYNPRISDGIKFNEYYNRNTFDENKMEYFKLWLQLVCKHPTIALESYTISTLGYWYPNIEYWSIENKITENEFNLEIQSKLPAISDKFFKKIEGRNVPLLNIEWSIGLCFWIILIFGVLSFKLNGKNGIYPYIPIFGIWITMMIAAPVYAEFRYVYGAYTSLPLLMLSPYLVKNICNKGVKNEKK